MWPRAKARVIDLTYRAGWVVTKAPPPWSTERHLREQIERHDVQMVFDVGGHVGEYAYALRREIGFGGPVVSFEPNGDDLEVATGRMTGDTNWRGEQFALGREAGRQQLNVTVRSNFSSFRTPRQTPMHRWATEVLRQEEVEVRRLDDVAGLYAPPDTPTLLKVDTQGFDLEVLAGARETIARQVVVLQIEAGVQEPVYEGVPSFAETVTAVRELGFELTWLSPVARSPSGALVECDLIAQRRR